MGRSTWGAIASLMVAGCQALGVGSGASADEYFYDCMDAARPPGLTVFATDEAFQELLKKEATTAPTRDDMLAPRLTAPASPGTLSADSPPRFSLVTMQARLQSRVASGCPAVSGDNYLFRVNDGDTTIYTALLSVTSFTPGAAAWKRALDGRVGHPVTVTIERATFASGIISQGPYVATIAPTFSVGP